MPTSAWSAASSDLVRYARIIWASATVQLKFLTTQPWIMFFLLAEPFMVASVAFLMVGNRPAVEASYVVVGTALIGLFTGFLFFGGTQMNQERAFGTVEILEASPAPMFVVVTGKVAGAVVLTLISGGLACAQAVLLFGYRLEIADPAGFVVSAVLAMTCLWGLGMLFSPLSFVWPDVNGLMTGLQYPLFILGGFLFPVAFLPETARSISYLLPPYWAAAALHGTSSGAFSTDEIIAAWTALAAGGAIFAWAAVLIFGFALRRARREGRLAWT